MNIEKKNKAKKNSLSKDEQDKSWNALFNPGEGDQYFMEPAEEILLAGLDGFNLNNAWWLSEFSRVTYRLDDEFRDTSNIDGSRKILSQCDITIKQLITDTNTSTCAALFQTDCIDLHGNRMPCYVLSFCGTNDRLDWKTNLQAIQDDFFNTGKVHVGFLKSYLSVRENFFELLSEFDKPLFITGHSLGGALATLVCADLELQGIGYDACYTFGSPRVGDAEFIRTISITRFFRVINNCDIVTTVPVSLGRYQYRHAGSGCFIDRDGSIREEVDEEEINQLQQQYIPTVLSNLSLEYLTKKQKELVKKSPVI